MDNSIKSQRLKPCNAIIASRLTVLLNYALVSLHDRDKADTEILLGLAYEMSSELFNALAETEGYRG